MVVVVVMAVLKLPLFSDCDRCYISREDYSETESLFRNRELDELITFGGRFADQPNWILN